ncbi:MAG: DEAD/DEAH box helicase [Armatimonadetes bacterium]|nr:DEAD/DEAH box helicase [Armatimonadota bacterium]
MLEAGQPFTVVVDRPGLDRLAAGLTEVNSGAALGSPEDREIRALAARLSLVRGFDSLLALPHHRFEAFPHQLQAAGRVLREMRGRALLADEVGLGKTIEAGIILKELLVRGLVRRFLILTPPALVGQWQEELAEKFGEQIPVAEKPSDWERLERAIGSLDTAKQARHSEHVCGRPWDLVVVDEAHRVTNPRTLAHRLVAQLQPRYLLLLTATPVQNDLRELYHLVSLLRPGQLGAYRSFRRQFVASSDARQALNPARLRLLLAGCMVRNRRALVSVKLPPRRATTHLVTLSDPEEHLYRSVAELSRGLRIGGAESRTPLLLLQEACSSPDAVAATLSRSGGHPALHRAAAAVRSGSKVEALLRLVRDTGEKVLVFTEFRATQERIRSALTEAGIATVCFHGSMGPDERVAAVRAFHREARVLVSTASGAEGQNLQFCHVLVNFDLPWNPMRLEQRIGRLHRLGQEREVHVFNLAAAGTVEADILDLLQNKIRMFELVVGELDLILGLISEERSFEEAVARVWLESENTQVYHDQMARLGDSIVQARRTFDDVRASELLLAEVFPEE